MISCKDPENETMKKTNTAALYFCIIVTVVGFVVLVETHPGKSALSFVPDRFTGGRWNEQTVRRLLQDEREWAFQLGRRSIAEQQQQGRRRRGFMVDTSLDPTAGVEEELELWECSKKRRMLKLTSLSLSTTAYQSAPTPFVPPFSENNQDDEVDTDEVECSICLVPLESGDRIGKLPCRHPMHIECLKPWLKRQNACPLCKRLQVAQPNYTTHQNNELTTTGSMNGLSNTRSTEVFSSTHDLMQESEVAADSVHGQETRDPAAQAENESIHQL